MNAMGAETGNPTTSVVMPAYNAERYIEAAIRSVMAQTVTDWELIVVDDCSRDGTAAIVERLAREDGRIRLFRNPQNLGVAATRNAGLSYCKGRYIALLDSDDIWRNEKLSKQIETAEGTDADIVYCSYGIIDENGEPKCADFVVPEITDFHASLTKSVISCSTALFRAESIQNYRFEAEYYHEDLVLWLRMLRDGLVARGCVDVLADYRVINGTRSANKLMSAIFRWDIYKNMLGLSAWKSMALLVKYMMVGLLKYRHVKKHK